MTIDQAIMRFIGEVVLYGGVAAAIAYGIFHYLGKSWIESRFAERLQTNRHEQEKALEELRGRINRIFSRVERMHEKEFEVLPTAWAKLHESLWPLKQFMSSFQSFPDVGKMSEPQLNEYLKDCRLDDWEKDELRSSTNKTDYYIEHIYMHDLHRVRTEYSEFHTYFIKNKVFLSTEVKQHLSTIDDLMWEALITKEVRHDIGDMAGEIEAWQKLRDEVDPLVEKIEKILESRLRYPDE